MERQYDRPSAAPQRRNDASEELTRTSAGDAVSGPGAATRTSSGGKFHRVASGLIP